MKTTIIPLHKVPADQKANIIAIRCHGLKRRRLFDLGLIPGTKIKTLHKSPYGNPIAYLVRGAVIAMRNEDAQKIIVEYK